MSAAEATQHRGHIEGGPEPEEMPAQLLAPPASWLPGCLCLISHSSCCRLSFLDSVRGSNRWPDYTRKGAWSGKNRQASLSRRHGQTDIHERRADTHTHTAKRRHKHSRSRSLLIKRWHSFQAHARTSTENLLPLSERNKHTYTYVHTHRGTHTRNSTLLGEHAGHGQVRGVVVRS